ncbi:cobalamin biosynthesis protein [Succinivibrio dextrinosolvens]|jgi:cobalamin biosynthesis protein CobD/CbiB|uniref:cobalamin biosynthesis protein n=1 Tax=Succinivibrio dextrinosolvens TaxID=83771 RepID=UPI0024793B44|nr:cobalamin biosynthesis protein [Succinivibrio dextrinosolvens]
MPVEQIINAAKEASFLDVLSTFFSILEYPAITLLTAMLLEIILPIGKTLRLSSLKPFFENISRKVNKEENSEAQIIFSSVFLPFFIIIIAILIVFFLKFTVNHDVIVSLLLLPFLLESKPVLMTTLSVKHSLEEQNKDEAKKNLQEIMVRDCSKLSEMGINKAMAEATSMSMFANWFCILVWYILLGLEGAVIMQLVAVMNRSFSLKEKRNENFGIFIHKVEQIMMIPPVILLFIMMMFSFSFKRIISNMKAHLQTFVNASSCAVMDMLGSFANVSLGGPRYYEGELVRLPRLGGENEPEIATPLKLYNKLRFCGILFVCICVVLRIFLYSF